MRMNWPLILVDAAKIVLSYDTPVTLRQLFYRLVAKGSAAKHIHGLQDVIIPDRRSTA